MSIKVVRSSKLKEGNIYLVAPFDGAVKFKFICQNTVIINGDPILFNVMEHVSGDVSRYMRIGKYYRFTVTESPWYEETEDNK